MGSNSSYDYGLWTLVVINVLLFGIFVITFIYPKGKQEWRSMGMFIGFINALFTEMYGFPLTIFVLTSLFGDRLGISNTFSHSKGHLLATLTSTSNEFIMFVCFFGSIFMLIGLIIMGTAWRAIYKLEGELVTDGIYGYMRHPQYLGLFLITTGMLIQWPTFLTIIMWPVLMFLYFRLAKKEEKDLLERFGDRYREYQKNVPSFFPFISFSRNREITVEKENTVTQIKI